MAVVAFFHAFPCAGSLLPRTRVEYLDLQQVKPVESENQIKAEDLASIVPTDMGATNDDNAIRQRIMDRSLQSFVSSPVFRKTAIGKTAKALETMFSAGVSFGGKKKAQTATQSSTSSGPVPVTNSSEPVNYGPSLLAESFEEKSTEHKINFNLQPQQTLAQMKYTGFLNANLNYRLNQQELMVEMIRPIDDETQMIFDSSSSPIMGATNRVSVRWKWF